MNELSRSRVEDASFARDAASVGIRTDRLEERALTCAVGRRIKSVAQRIGLIVRRGALRRFDDLKKKMTDYPVTVSWDRRDRERRSSPEAVGRDQRKIDRRSQPSFTWELADFVVVEPNVPKTPGKP